MIRAHTFAVVCVAGLAGSARAGAAEGDAVRPPEALINLDYWSTGKVRPFLSSRLEAGLIYAKPQVAVGYGRPYWMWLGVEAFAITTNSFGAGYVGARGSLPFLNLTLGARDTFSYNRSTLPVREHYTADDVSHVTAARARYVTLEAELSSVLPVPGGYALLAPTLYAMTDAPAHRYVYEESLRAVIKPPFVWALRVAYLAAFGEKDIVKAGALFEIVGLPGRAKTILRAGPAVSVTLTDHLDLIGVFSSVLVSPDSLGIWHGPFGQLGARYYFASGESKPRFP